MSILLSRTSAVLGAGLGLSLTLSPLSPFRAAPMQCQYTAPYPRTGDNTIPGWGISADDPVLVKQGRTGRDVWGSSGSGSGILNASNMRQVSLGSVLGLVAGVGLRAFSRALVVLLGMGVVFVEWAASKGYNIIPVNRVQRYFKNTNLQRAMSRYVPFKTSFGATMALAAFAQF